MSKHNARKITKEAQELEAGEPQGEVGFLSAAGQPESRVYTRLREPHANTN